MDLWGWLIGYVVLFAVLHLLLYYYYVRQSNEDGAPSATDSNHAARRSTPRLDRFPSRSEDADDVRPEDTDDTRPENADDVRPEDAGDTRLDDAHPRARECGVTFDGETVRCAHCGVPNEADRTFTFCWNCTSVLRQ